MKNSDRSQPKPQNNLDCQPDRVLAVKWSSRWDVFRRLQGLGIKCQCSTNEPLLVDIDTPTTAIQIWSVLRQSSESRQELIDWLEGCWEVKCDRSVFE